MSLSRFRKAPMIWSIPPLNNAHGRKIALSCGEGNIKTTLSNSKDIIP